MLDSLVETCGIEDSVVELVSADGVGTLKPEAALYEYAVDRHDVPVDRGRMSPLTGWTCWVPSTPGYRGVWFDRGGTWLSFNDRRSLTVDSMDALCAALDA
jgi:FMN phosphatase YigB (HAD superfamily)